MGEGDKGAGMETLVVVDTEEASLLFDGRPPKIAHHSSGFPEVCGAAQTIFPLPWPEHTRYFDCRNYFGVKGAAYNR